MEEGNDALRGVVMYRPGDVRVVDPRRTPPSSTQPTRSSTLTATFISRSDLSALPRRQARRQASPWDMVSSRRRRADQLRRKNSETRRLRHRVLPHLRRHLRHLQSRIPSRCIHAQFMHGTIGTQSERGRIPNAEGTWLPPRHAVHNLFPASSPPPTSWAPAGSPPSPPTWHPVKPSLSSATAPSASSAFWPPASEGPSASSRSAGTPTGRRWPKSSAPPTSSSSAAPTASRASRS